MLPPLYLSPALVLDLRQKWKRSSCRHCENIDAFNVISR